MKKTIKYLFIALSFAAYILLANYAKRENFGELSLLFVILFGSFFVFWKQIGSSNEILFWSVAFRLIFLFSLPAFSDDFYRFIWDGQLLLHGYNPFNHLPPELMNEQLAKHIPISTEVYSHINSLQRSNYTCYPPFNQLFFAIAAFLGGQSVFGNMLALRIIILLADIGTIYFGLKILKEIKMPLYRMSIFAFNPLVINELTGNLHFEGVMAFFLVLGLYFMLRNKNQLSALLLGLTASVKLLPIMLIPSFYKRNGLRYVLIFGGLFLLLFSPVFFLSPTGNFYKSILIYFHTFEFNASVFYIFRALGFWLVGYDTVGIVGPSLALISMISILWVSFKHKNDNLQQFARALLLCFLIYFSLATTVHPWYLVTILILSVFSGNLTPMAWSAVIWLSYYTYSNPTFTESVWLLILEYTVMYGFFIIEFTSFGKKRFGGLKKQ